MNIEKNRNEKHVNDRDDAKFLWDEYRYRHELCWKVLFQITTAVIVLSVIPYIQKEVVYVLGWRIIAVPALALVLAILAIPVMLNELIVFGKVKEKYRAKQKVLFNIEHEENIFVKALKKLKLNPKPEYGSGFFYLVLTYLLGLVILCVINCIAVMKYWIPYVRP